MNREQMKYLKEQLRILRNRKQPERPYAPMPKSVASAKRMIQSWEAGVRREVERRRDRLEQKYAEAYQVFLFQDAAASLKALREFEKFQP